MERIKVKISGVNAILLHNDDGVNPTNPITKAIKRITSKGKKKTDEDTIRLLDLDYIQGIYHDDALKMLPYVLAANYSEKEETLIYNIPKKAKDLMTGSVFIPSENLESSIMNGAKKNKNGKQIQKTLMVFPENIPIIGIEDIPIYDMIQLGCYKDVRNVKIGQSKTLRCRPRFDKWSLEFEAEYEADIISGEEVEMAIRVAGREVGLGDYRPKYGRFTVDYIGRV
jgi:hypothetical protein